MDPSNKCLVLKIENVATFIKFWETLVLHQDSGAYFVETPIQCYTCQKKWKDDNWVMYDFTWKILFGVLREMPGFTDQTIHVFEIFTARSCDTTQFLHFLAVVIQFLVIFLAFSVQNTEKFVFFHFQNQATFEGFCDTSKKFFLLYSKLCFCKFSVAKKK